MIEIKNLSKFYGPVQVLDSINLTINKGDVYGLVGRSGAGKSTLLRCINGLEKLSSGGITVNGIAIEGLSDNMLRETRKDIGMIFQHFSLIDRKSVYDNVALPMQCWHKPVPQQREKIEYVIELVGLADKINTKTRELSGGQKQRVAIARAMVMDPAILLSDEATSALDPRTTDEILELLMSLNEKLGVTIIAVTHQMSVVRKICTKMAILENDKCDTTGEVREIFIQQPPALTNLLGDGEVEIPAHGCTVQVVTLEQHTQQELFYKMSCDVGQPYQLLDSKVSRHRSGVYGVFALNFSSDHADVFLPFFQKQGVPCKIISQ